MVLREPSQEMNRNPLASVPAMAPSAPTANICPRMRPARSGAPAIAKRVSTGPATPAKKAGKKKAAPVSRPRVTKTWPSLSSRGTAKALRIARLARELTAAPKKAKLNPRLCRLNERSATNPPYQWPAESPARTTAITAVQL